MAARVEGPAKGQVESREDEHSRRCFSQEVKGVFVCAIWVYTGLDTI
jgi:hypothetical protein